MNSPSKSFVHTVEFLVGFQSYRLTDLIHFVNKSGLLKRNKKIHLLSHPFVISRVLVIHHTLTALTVLP